MLIIYIMLVQNIVNTFPMSYYFLNIVNDALSPGFRVHVYVFDFVFTATL